MRILVIDHDSTQIDLLTQVLRGEGHEVLAATSAPLALIATHQGMPDAVFTDLYLSGPDGLDLCDRMRAMGAIGDVPIIVISSSDSEIDQQRARKAGALAFLVKPIDANDVRAVVQGLVTLCA